MFGYSLPEYGSDAENLTSFYFLLCFLQSSSAEICLCIIVIIYLQIIEIPRFGSKLALFQHCLNNGPLYTGYGLQLLTTVITTVTY